MSPAGIKECERGRETVWHVIGIVAKNIASGDQNGNFFPSNQKPQRQLHSVYGFCGRSEVWRAPYLAIPGAPPLAVPVIESTFLLLYAFMFGRCFILAMLLSCPGGGLNVYLFTLAWCDLYWLEHWQVKTLCEKAKEILMEESNVQVRVYGRALSQLLLLSFSYCCYNV